MILSLSIFPHRDASGGRVAATRDNEPPSRWCGTILASALALVAFYVAVLVSVFSPAVSSRSPGRGYPLLLDYCIKQCLQLFSFVRLYTIMNSSNRK